MTGPGLYTFPQTLAGPHAVGKWYGWQNGFANFAGITGPALTGFVLEATGKYVAPFAITAAICLAGALAWVFVVGRVEQVLQLGPQLLHLGIVEDLDAGNIAVLMKELDLLLAQPIAPPLACLCG